MWLRDAGRGLLKRARRFPPLSFPYISLCIVLSLLLSLQIVALPSHSRKSASSSSYCAGTSAAAAAASDAAVFFLGCSITSEIWFSLILPPKTATSFLSSWLRSISSTWAREGGRAREAAHELMACLYAALEAPCVTAR